VSGVTIAVHRIVEQRAGDRPDAVALVEGRRATTYRELNLTANTLARRLAASGLTRGALAVVRLPRSTDLAVVLLAVLKAGASYTWIEPGSADDIDIPVGLCILRGAGDREQEYLALDITEALRQCASKHGPNLPVLTRGSDVACVLPDRSGHPHVLVPHATITALVSLPIARGRWDGAAGALDLWVGLMAGATLALTSTPATAAA
jgi:non-ribosomal peptide synthetase component F